MVHQAGCFILHQLLFAGGACEEGRAQMDPSEFRCISDPYKKKLKCERKYLCSKWGFIGIRVTCLGSGKAFVLYYYKHFYGLINGMIM